MAWAEGHVAVAAATAMAAVVAPDAVTEGVAMAAEAVMGAAAAAARREGAEKPQCSQLLLIARLLCPATQVHYRRRRRWVRPGRARRLAVGAAARR